MKNLLITAIIMTMVTIMPTEFIIADNGIDQNECIPFHFELNNCDNTDYIVLDGMLHELSDWDGRKWLHHFNLNMDGFGTISGDKYIANEIWNQVAITSVPFINTIHRTVIIIGQGDAPNLHLRLTFVITTDKDNITKVHIDDIQIVCG